MQFQQAPDRRPGFIHLSGTGQRNAETQECGNVARILLDELAQPRHRLRELSFQQKAASSCLAE